MIGATNCDSNVFERFDKFTVYRPDIDIKKAFSG
ncbi:cytochrome, partial [Bacillus thuringiensis]|nr:cytochrome [Bacillus thuringiensis]